MKITILTLFPEQFIGFIETSIIKKAVLKGIVEIECIDIREFTLDKHNRVDDKPYGGGAGLVMRAQPVLDALRSVKTDQSVVIVPSASGKKYTQEKAEFHATHQHIILICGHYEGMDERIMDEVDYQYCIGDYILTGGELAAMVISDSIIRLIDGVITKESNDEESFVNGLVEYPHYTTPFEYEGKTVPEVLISGHHKNIERYRLKESLRRTKENRPDLLENREFSPLELELLMELD